MSLSFKSKLNSFSQPSLINRGFSLPELLVTIAIISAVMTVVVFNQRTYSEGAALSNIIDNLSSNISQAQVYGIAVREVAPGSDDFNSAYGLAFSLLEESSDTSYLFFVDKDTSNHYSGDWDCQTGEAFECIEKINLNSGFFIEEFCVVRANGTDQCGNVTSRVDVTFLRPNTDARIIFFNNGGQEFNPPNMIGVRINISSSQGATRSVIIYKTGQVSVE